MSLWLLIYYKCVGAGAYAQKRIHGFYTSLDKARAAESQLLGATAKNYVGLPGCKRNDEGLITWVMSVNTNTEEDVGLDEIWRRH